MFGYPAILNAAMVLAMAGAVHGEPLELKASPRLWVGRDTALNLRDKLHTPYLESQAARVLADADWLVDAKPLAEDEAHTYQQGTRAIASHLQCLTAAWVLTHEAKYRQAAIRHLANVLTWNQISCEARRGMSPDEEMFFCLSYGEHAADIGLMYDLFRSDITAAERQVFFDVLDRFYLKQALACLDDPPWWANKSWSNWNGVCAGGMGIMALAFYEDRPECQALIPFVEKSLGEYFKSYIRNGGGCHEGTGYWNYGMHYAMRYLLSWENATGRKHPAFGIAELGTSLHFPLDFTGLSFGDNDGWHPTGFFFMLTGRLDQPEAALRAATYLPERVEAAPAERSRLARVATGDILYGADFMPTAVAMARLKEAHAKQKDPVARVYRGLGWAVLADDSAFPALRLSARGGSNAIAGHGHLDLLSFKCMVNGERLIADQEGGSPVVNFTEYGHHLYSRSAAAKSTLFVDGLGCRENAVCDLTEVVKDGDLLGIRIDGSHAYLPRWRRGFIGRLFLMVEGRYWLVVDAAPGHRMESRFHTYADYTRDGDSVSLASGREQLQMTFAALGGGVIQESRGMPTVPQQQTRIVRWIGNGVSHNSLQVTALNPGSEKLGLQLSKDKGGGFVIAVSGQDGYQRNIRVTPSLELKPSPNEGRP